MIMITITIIIMIIIMMMIIHLLVSLLSLGSDGKRLRYLILNVHATRCT